MAATLYLLCMFTALACCLLLLRAHRRTRAWLLLWSGLCFGGLTLENLFLFLDRVMYPDVDLSVWRAFFSLAGVSLLLYGLIRKSQ